MNTSLNTFRVRSQGLLRNIDIMDRLWNNVLKPKMFYGKEILVYGKEWLRQLESVQHQIVCKILGVNRSVNRAGMKVYNWDENLQKGK